MRTFKLVRKEDVSGVSGTGVVAEGVEFHDGQVVMSWFGRHHTLVTAPDIETIERIHGHGGSTKVVWDAKPDLTDLRLRAIKKYLRRASVRLDALVAAKKAGA